MLQFKFQFCRACSILISAINQLQAASKVWFELFKVEKKEIQIQLKIERKTGKNLNQNEFFLNCKNKFRLRNCLLNEKERHFF